MCDGARTGCRSRSAALVGWRSYVSLFPFAITAPAIVGAGVTRDDSIYHKQHRRTIPSFPGRPERTSSEAGPNERTNIHSSLDRPPSQPTRASHKPAIEPQPGYSYSFSSARRLREGGGRGRLSFLNPSSSTVLRYPLQSTHARLEVEEKVFFQKKLHSHGRRAVYDPPRLRSLCFSPLPKGAQEPPPRFYVEQTSNSRDGSDAT